MISFKVNNPAELQAIETLARRASDLAERSGFDYPIMDALMDITATHVNGCPLRLGEMLEADDLDFGHDVFGIRRHIDRKTGHLMDCFLPRYAAPELASEGGDHAV